MAVSTPVIDFELVFRQISYLEDRDLKADLSKFHKYIEGDIEGGRVTLLRSLGGWTKPFYLVFDALPMPMIPDSKLTYKAYTFALQSTDGLSYQIAYLEIDLDFNKTRILHILNDILKMFTNVGWIHLILAIVCDRGPINIIAQYNSFDIPVLWNYRDCQDSLALSSNKHFILQKLYSNSYFPNSVEIELNKLLEYNVTLNDELEQSIVLDEIQVMRGVINKYFLINPTASHFQPSFGNIDSLKAMGRRWKIGLREALKFLNIDGERLTEHAEKLYPKLLGVLALTEAKRIN